MNTLISILSGDIWNDNGVWRTKDFDDKAGGALFSDFRMPAAAVLAQNPHTVLLLHGGLRTDERPSLSSVMRRELMELKVPEDSMIIEEVSETTYQQLLALQEVLHLRRPGSTNILSNEWHLPRIATMLECAPALSFLLACNPELVAAEQVLLNADAGRWRTDIEAVRESPQMQTRRALEEKGVEDLGAGLYHFR